jgi:hypothetical protein
MVFRYHGRLNEKYLDRGSSPVSAGSDSFCSGVDLQIDFAPDYGDNTHSFNGINHRRMERWSETIGHAAGVPAD